MCSVPVCHVYSADPLGGDMRNLAAMLLCGLVAACAYGSGPTQVVPGSEVGGVGNIRYDHKQINTNTHMLTVNVSPGMLETEGSMSQRKDAVLHRTKPDLPGESERG